MRLRLIPDDTNIDFFKHARLTFGASCVAVLLALAVWFTMGLNYGIDFRGGTTLRTQSDAAVDVAAYRTALEPLELGDVSISEVFDPASDSTKHVAMVRIQAQEGEEAASPEMIQNVEEALKTVAPNIVFTSVESVGPKVSGELIQTAFLAVAASLGAKRVPADQLRAWREDLRQPMAELHARALARGQRRPQLVQLGALGVELGLDGAAPRRGAARAVPETVL